MSLQSKLNLFQSINKCKMTEESLPSVITKDSSIIKFLFKLFFICKAAMDGFSIRYLGSNSFEFQKQLEENEEVLTSNQFVEKYSTFD